MTFLEKKVIPLATSGRSELGNTVNELKIACSKVQRGLKEKDLQVQYQKKNLKIGLTNWSCKRM